MVSFKHKLILVLVAISFGSLALLSAFNVYSTMRDNEADLQKYRDALYVLFDLRIKSQVETAHSLVANIYRQQQAGLLSESEAKKRAADLIPPCFWLNPGCNNEPAWFAQFRRKAIRCPNRLNRADTYRSVQ